MTLLPPPLAVTQDLIAIAHENVCPATSPPLHSFFARLVGFALPETRISVALILPRFLAKRRCLCVSRLHVLVCLLTCVLFFPKGVTNGTYNAGCAQLAHTANSYLTLIAFTHY